MELENNNHHNSNQKRKLRTQDIYNDDPIRTNDEDVLNRSDFAEDFANTILNYFGPESLTIGLIGKWGSGKSSIINLAKEHMDYEHVVIIDFNPWYFSTQDNLYQQFFNILIHEAEKRQFHNKKGLSKKLFQIKLQWKKASKVTNNPETLKQYFNTNNSIIKRIQRKWGRIRNYPNYCYIKFRTFFSFDSPEILNKYFNHIKSNSRIDIKYKIMNSINIGYSYDFDDMGKEYNYISLLKEKCNHYFNNLSHKFVIIIDDLDRMTDEEIKQILILVKSVADFKDFIYVLSFDKYVVSKAIGDDFGEKYLEKIINVSIDMPIITRNELKDLLKKGIKEVSEKFDIVFEENKLNSILDRYDSKSSLNYGIINYFETIRDVKRFLNVLTFNIAPIKNEVNFLDFITITTIQMFKPGIYDKIKSNESLLIKYFIPKFQYSSQEDVVSEEITSFENLVGGDEEIKHILQDLFPKMSFIYHTNILSDYSSEYDRDLRICHENHFKTYFKLSPIVKKISETEGSIIINFINSKDEQNLFNQFKDFQGEDKLRLLLKFLLNRMPKITEPEFFLKFIFSLEIKFDEDIFISIQYSLIDILLELLRKINDENRFLILKEEYVVCHNVYFLYIIIKYIEQNNFMLYEDKKLLEASNIESLKDIIRHKYNQSLLENSINPKYRLTNYLEIGVYLGLKEENDKFIEKLISTKEGLLLFLDSLLDERMNMFVNSEISNINYFSNMEIIKCSVDEHYDELQDEILIKKFLRDYEVYKNDKID